jgi:hypothetical protein
MDDNNLLRTAFFMLVAAIVLVAVIAAGYMLVSAIFGGSGPAVMTPTPTATPLPTTYVVVPSGPFVPTTSPSGYPVIATPVQPRVEGAELLGYGTDKDTYKRGDTALVYLIIKNAGNVAIEEATIKASVAKYFSVIGYVNVENPQETLTELNIQPGETSNSTYSIVIPETYQGLSTAGDFQFTIDVYVWNKDIGTFTKKVKVE